MVMLAEITILPINSDLPVWEAFQTSQRKLAADYTDEYRDAPEA